MTRLLLPLLAAAALAGCGVETAVTAGASAEIKRREMEAAKKNLEQAQQKIEQSTQQVMKQAEQQAGAADKN